MPSYERAAAIARRKGGFADLRFDMCECDSGPRYKYNVYPENVLWGFTTRASSRRNQLIGSFLDDSDIAPVVFRLCV